MRALSRFSALAPLMLVIRGRNVQLRGFARSPPFRPPRATRPKSVSHHGGPQTLQAMDDKWSL